MSMNLIAILVSLAMMLTGAGGASQAKPAAETARTLTLTNVNVTWNGETLRLGTTAHAGVSTDGAKAVFDFGVDLGDKKLMPMQVAVDESGITALSGNSGVAVTVTAKALGELAEQLEAQVNASLAQAEGDGAQVIQFIAEEYMPAYINMLKLAMDPTQWEQVNAAAQAVFDRVVDRGEGKPATLEVDGESYPVTAYSYSLDAMQMAALTDAMYGEIPAINDYYSAMFKLYSMMPEESGLKDVTSFTDLFEKFGVQMQLDFEEQRSDDGSVDQMDAVLTIDLNGMMAMAQQAAGEAPEAMEAALESTLETEAAEAPQTTAPEASGETVPEEAQDGAEALPALEPIVMNFHTLKLNDYTESNGSCVYAIDEGHSVDFSMTATQSTGVQEVEATVTLSEDGKKTHGGKVSAFMAQDDTGTVSYSVNMKAIKQDTAKVDSMFYGVQYPDGTSENSAAFDLRSSEANCSVSFDLNVTADPIENVAGGAENAVVIDDLSQVGLEALEQDPALIGAALQIAGAFTRDFATLKNDPDVKALKSLVKGDGLPIDVDELNATDFGDGYELDDAAEDDGNYELVIGDDGDAYDAGEGDASTFDVDDEPVEDDGVLAFPEPRMTWLPKGWTVSATEKDTAYDWVQLSISDADGVECAYAIFFLDPEVETAYYIVKDDGKVVDGRMMNVTDFGEGGLSVTISENGMYGNLMFLSEAIELDTIGQIVAGIQF